jgi:hypothetical protein
MLNELENLSEYELDALEGMKRHLEEIKRQNESINTQITSLQETTKNSSEGIMTVLAVGAAAWLIGKGIGLVEENKKMERIEFLERHEFEIEKQTEAFLKNKSEVRKFVSMYVAEKHMSEFIKQRTKGLTEYTREKAMISMQSAILGQNKKTLECENVTVRHAIEECVADSIRYKESIASEIEEEVKWYLTKDEKIRKIVHDSVIEKFMEDNFKGTDDPAEAIAKQLQKKAKLLGIK